MLGSLSRWRPRQLWRAWIAYWIFVLLVGLGPAIPLVWRLSRAGSHGSVSASATNGAVRLSIATAAETWARSVSYGALTLLVIVPPLLLWVAWAAARPRRAA